MTGARDPARCFHCGEANPQRTSWRAAIAGADAFFCCPGCLAVAQTIGAAGLSSFYALRERECAPQRNADAAGQQPGEAGAASTLIRTGAGGLSDVALLLDGMLLMAWNVVKTVAIGRAADAEIPSVAGAVPAAA